MTTAADVLKSISDNDVKFVDVRFTDPRGKMQHVTMDVSQVDEDMFADGIMFDGSSIAGWKAINESDMVLMPDTETAHMDPFFAQPTMAIFCDISTRFRRSLQPRSAHDRQEGRSLREVRRHRRHHHVWPGS
jgi:glutamine synthetase